MADEFPEELVKRCAEIICAENDIAPPAAWDAAIAVLRASGYANLIVALKEAKGNILSGRATWAVDDTYADAFREAAITGQAFVKDGRLLKSEDVYAPPPPPTLGDVELWEPIRQVLVGRKEDTTAYYEFCAALRQRADEAARNENIGCAALVERLLQRTYPMDSAYEPIVAAIRARIAPKEG